MTTQLASKPRLPHITRMTALADIALPDRTESVLLAWPTAGNPGAFLEFSSGTDWRRFVSSLGVHPHILDPVQRKSGRAQMLYLVGWLDFSLVKAGELAALIALELAVMDRYGGDIPKRRRSFAALLRHMVDADGLGDANIPMIVRCGGTAIGQLTGDVHPTLAERRTRWRMVTRLTACRPAACSNWSATSSTMHIAGTSRNATPPSPRARDRRR